MKRSAVEMGVVNTSPVSAKHEKVITHCSSDDREGQYLTGDQGIDLLCIDRQQPLLNDVSPAA